MYRQTTYWEELQLKNRTPSRDRLPEPPTAEAVTHPATSGTIRKENLYKKSHTPVDNRYAKIYRGINYNIRKQGKGVGANR